MRCAADAAGWQARTEGLSACVCIGLYRAERMSPGVERGLRVVFCGRVDSMETSSFLLLARSAESIRYLAGVLLERSVTPAA